MILRRLTANLRAQNWTAITIDFAIVVIGVFLGIEASDWNQGRLAKHETDTLLVEMRPELQRMHLATTERLNYYQTARRFADTALAGWAGDPKVSDRDFVIAAYQASQITGARGDSPLKTILDAQDIRKIDEPALRWALLRVLNFNYDAVSASGMQTHYREDLRQIIPADIQDVVRRECGDRPTPNGMPVLPKACPADIPSARAATAADVLRAHPELARELQFHLSQVANFELNTVWLDEQVVNLQKQLSSKFGKRA